MVHSPYVSIWSSSNNLYDSDLEHWTGDKLIINGRLNVDNNCYNFMGLPNSDNCYGDVKTMTQTNVKVDFLSTIYTFSLNDITLTLTFRSNKIPTDYNKISIPFT